jgi:uncharacterized damage-inducible protein DinB
MARELLLDLFDHMEWADARVWETVLPHDAARHDEALRDLLLHLHGVQRGFLDAWTGQPFVYRGNDSTTLEREFATVQSYYASARTFLESLDSQRLASPLIVPWTKWVEQAIGRPPADTTLGETVLQACLHSTHHRAQANARLRALGAQPPLVDYIAWLWLGRPQPSWPVMHSIG